LRAIVLQKSREILLAICPEIFLQDFVSRAEKTRAGISNSMKHAREFARDEKQNAMITRGESRDVAREE
jgi:hypothetical protein